MNRKKVATLAAIAMSGLVGVGLAVTGTAHAGVNGQQIRVCAPGGDFKRVVLEGTNQNGESTDVTRDFKGDCHVIANYYWVGPVKVTLTRFVNDAGAETVYYCDVRKEVLPIEFDVMRCDP